MESSLRQRPTRKKPKRMRTPQRAPLRALASAEWLNFQGQIKAELAHPRELVAFRRWGEGAWSWIVRQDFGQTIQKNQEMLISGFVFATTSPMRTAGTATSFRAETSES